MFAPFVNLMNYIDLIYYTATSTDLTTGSSTVINAQYYAPFLDFLLVFLVFSFTILSVWFTNWLMYPRKSVVRIKNTLKVLKKDLWN